jgi:hypothetical protein
MPYKELFYEKPSFLYHQHGYGDIFGIGNRWPDDCAGII